MRPDLLRSPVCLATARADHRPRRSADSGRHRRRRLRPKDRRPQRESRRGGV